MRLIDADKLIEGRANNDPVVIACNAEPTSKIVDRIMESIDYCDRQIELSKENIAVAEECMRTYEQSRSMFERLLANCKGAENDG